MARESSARGAGGASMRSGIGAPSVRCTPSPPPACERRGGRGMGRAGQHGEASRVRSEHGAGDGGGGGAPCGASPWPASRDGEVGARPRPLRSGARGAPPLLLETLGGVSLAQTLARLTSRADERARRAYTSSPTRRLTWTWTWTWTAWRQSKSVEHLQTCSSCDQSTPHDSSIHSFPRRP